MKASLRLLILITALALFWTVPASAQPHCHSSPYYVSHYCACGGPVYMQRVFRGYDSCGRAIWVVQPFNAHLHRHCASRNRQASYVIPYGGSYSRGYGGGCNTGYGSGYSGGYGASYTRIHSGSTYRPQAGVVQGYYSYGSRR